ncbi:heme-binding domain-containing protein [Algoriphagus machipongonensis]|uniref:Haem-binding domain-containing protein n=1 Tax=Algoriphagus machipongonensis TaxID=388413 RepID=A3I016_9BACT|nr:heme-binding domain-containing protein [Algoriphagus machipongonensis]EAZ80852.1 hypothetical protein ALPR1_08000 [Algoriphagus machipongonensis]
MKKTSLLFGAAITGLLFFQATQKPEAESHPELLGLGPKLPTEVKAVVEQKCYGCHNEEAKNDKGKEKLDWDKFEDSKKSKQFATMSKISEVLEEGEMPPKKFLEFKPEGALTDEEKTILLDWSTRKKKNGE